LLNVGQQQVLNLTWLLLPGSIQSAVLTGMLGLLPRPTQIEVLGWAIYLVLGLAFVLRPRRSATHRGLPRATASAGV
jgi:high-affinity iron transporter